MARLKDIIFSAGTFILCLIAALILMVCGLFDKEQEIDPYDEEYY